MRKEKIKHVDSIFNSNYPFTLDFARSIPNSQKSQYHQLIVKQRIYKHLIVHIKIHFIIKLVIHMTVQHHIPQIQFFKNKINSCIGINLSADNVKDLSPPLNGSSNSAISNITPLFNLVIWTKMIPQSKSVPNINNKNIFLIIQLI